MQTPIKAPTIRQRKHSYPLRLIGFVSFSLLAILVCIKLGTWQLSRAQEKQALLDIEQRVITALAHVSAADLHQKVSILGSFDNQQPILLDNQINNKRIGYHLYLPFHSDGHTILVNLGWLAAPASRAAFPDIPPFTGDYHLTGTLSAQQGSPLLLGDNVTAVGSNAAKSVAIKPLVMQRTDLSQLQYYLKTPLKPLLLQLNPDSNIGFSKTWQMTVMSPAKHTAYAVQWFALAFALSLCSGFWLSKYRNQHKNRQDKD